MAIALAAFFPKLDRNYLIIRVLCLGIIRHRKLANNWQSSLRILKFAIIFQCGGNKCSPCCSKWTRPFLVLTLENESAL